MPVMIELSDEQAAALNAQAAAQGLTLQEWLQTLTTRPAQNGQNGEEIDVGRREALHGSAEDGPRFRTFQEAVARIRELQKHVKPDPDGWTIKDYINYGRQ